MCVTRGGLYVWLVMSAGVERLGTLFNGPVLRGKLIVQSGNHTQEGGVGTLRLKVLLLTPLLPWSTVKTQAC